MLQLLRLVGLAALALGCSDETSAGPSDGGSGDGSGGSAGAASDGASDAAAEGDADAPTSGFFVAPHGSDQNPGTLAEPWRSVQHAIDHVPEGETVWVRAGVYAEGAEHTRAATSGAWITLAAYPGEIAVLGPLADQPSGEHHGFEIRTGAAFFRLRGFVIEGAYAFDCSAHPLTIYGAHDVEIADCEVRGGRAGSGIYLEEESARVAILRNVIHDHRDDVDCNGTQAHGIYAQGSDHLIANNLIYDHPEGYGLQAYDSGARNVFVHNTVVESSHSGIVIGGSKGYTEPVVANNVLANNGIWGIAWEDGPVSGCVITHNLFFGNGSGDVEPGAPAGCAPAASVASDPLFADPAARDYRLAPGSPARDAAHPDHVVSPALGGTPRPSGPDADLGAYEAAD